VANKEMFSDLIRVDKADVYKAGILAGQLHRASDHVSFSYNADYAAVRSEPVATTLPISTEPLRTPARSVPAYFAGLLPEGRRLTALRSAIKTSADDDFALLLAVGGDPIGDVQVVVSGEIPPPFGSPSAANARSNSDDFANLSFRELFAEATGAKPDRGGIAGVQDKVSGQMISVPISYGAGVILKFDPPEYPHLVANEAFFLTMARDCGIVTGDWRVVNDRDGMLGLLVSRFDRILLPNGLVGGLACEDGCQLANRYPGDKYALDTEMVFRVVANSCAAPKAAANDLLRQFLFAYITGNGDWHAKNVSVLRRANEWEPSPAYDLPSSYPYGDKSLAMAVNGTRQAQISRKAVLQLAESVGVPERAALMTLDDLLAAAEPWIVRLPELPFDQQRMRHLRRAMTSRLKLLSPAPLRTPRRGSLIHGQTPHAG
jgi:serine/threonine-protein kinase HipA